MRSNACHDTLVQTLGNTTAWLNHWEGGLGVQPAVELACVVGHFGSKTAQPVSVRANKKPTHPHLRSLMIGFTESLSSGTNAGLRQRAMVLASTPD